MMCKHKVENDDEEIAEQRLLGVQEEEVSG